MIYNDADIQQEIKEIYLQYHNSIKIFIGQLEVLQNKFPVEIWACGHFFRPLCLYSFYNLED